MRLHTSCCFQARDGKYYVVTIGGTTDGSSDHNRKPTAHINTLKWGTYDQSTLID